MKKILFTFLVLFLITLPTIVPYFNARFFYTQDYIFIARLNQITTALSDGHFPVRWAPDLRYGEPTFNYYAALPYYLGAVIHLLGFNFIWTAKILFMLSSILSAVTMYIFTQKLFGKRGALLSTVLYIYAPYRAVDMYVRGALSEAWSFIFFPLIFYASLLLSQKINYKRVLLLSLSLAGLFLTHNVTTLMFLPFLLFWWLSLLFNHFSEQRKWSLILAFLISFILGLGTTAFFLLPATLERNYIQTKYLIVGYFNFRAHFVAVSQFFSTFWGYGSSLWGPQDGLSFQVGLANWATCLLAIILGFIYRRDKKRLCLLVLLGSIFLFSIFIQHNKSAFIWEAIPLMAFIQFPWRFLAISIFIISIIGGAITPYLKHRLILVYFLLLIFSIISTIGYFKPKEYVDDVFFEKFLNKEIMRKGVDLTKDYLPIWVQTTDGSILNYPEAEEGKIEVSSFEKKTAKAQAQINVLEDSIIEVPITYFPGWTIIANNQNVTLDQPFERGLIRFKLPEGNYNVKFEFKDTPVRIVGNVISLTSVLLLILLLTTKRFYKYE